MCEGTDLRRTLTCNGGLFGNTCTVKRCCRGAPEPPCVCKEDVDDVLKIISQLAEKNTVLEKSTFPLSTATMPGLNNLSARIASHLKKVTDSRMAGDAKWRARIKTRRDTLTRQVRATRGRRTGLRAHVARMNKAYQTKHRELEQTVRVMTR